MGVTVVAVLDPPLVTVLDDVPTPELAATRRPSMSRSIQASCSGENGGGTGVSSSSAIASKRQMENK